MYACKCLGFLNYCERYGKGIYETSSSFEPPPHDQIDELVDKIASYVESKMPVTDLAKWRAHRDQCLAGLAKLKRDAQR